MIASSGQTRVLRVDPAEIDRRVILHAASLLKSGGLVIYPTETFYALGAVPGIAEAVQMIFNLKGRDTGKPLPLIASDLNAAKSAGSEWPEAAEKLARKFWPGPLSIIIPAAPSFHPILHSRTGKIAVRVSPHPVAVSLAHACGGLIVSTSSNRAGMPPSEKPGGVDSELFLSVQALIDAGDLSGGLPSAIVDVTVRPAVLVRAGGISWEHIRRLL